MAVQYVGAGQLLMHFLAFRFPNTFRRLFSESTFNAFVPVILHSIKQKKWGICKQYFNILFYLCLQLFLLLKFLCHYL